MAEMGQYCKAYPIARFRSFPGWQEQSANARQPLNDESVLYLQENLVVTDGVFKDEHVIYDRVTPDWELFCRETLQFSVPEWVTNEGART